MSVVSLNDPFYKQEHVETSISNRRESSIHFEPAALCRKASTMPEFVPGQALGRGQAAQGNRAGD